MTIVISSSTATQSGTDTSLGTAIDTMTGITVVQSYLRVMPDGSKFIVNGNFSDATGNFALMLVGNAKFGTSTTGVARIGLRTLVAGIPTYSGGGTLIIKPLAAENPNGEGNINYLLGGITGTSLTGTLSLFDMEIIDFSLTSNNRINQFMSNMAGCKFRAINQGVGVNQFTCIRFQSNAIVDDNVIENVFQFEFHGQPASFSRNTFVNTYGFISYSSGALIFLDNIKFTGSVANCGITNNGGLYYVNTYKDGVEMTEAFINALLPSPWSSLGIMINTDPALHGMHWGKTHREIIKNPSGTALSNAIVYFKDSYTTPTVFLPTVTGGAYTQTIRLKRATSTGYASIAYANYYPITKLVCEYNSVLYSEVFSTYDAMTAQTVQQTRVLPVDVNVTLSQSAANTILANNFTVSSSTGTITVRASSILDQLYDALKAWKCTAVQANLEYPTVNTQPVTASGTVLSTAMSIVINSGVTLSTGIKGTSLVTTGSFTNAGILSCSVTVATVNNTGTLSSGITITGNVSQATPTNLSGVTITGNLTYNTNTPITITFTNCVVTGTISNSGSGLITISTSNSTIGTIGSNITSRLVTSLNINGLTAGSQIYIVDNSGNQIDYVSSSGTSYTLNTTGGIGTWTWKVARYGYTAQTGTHQPAIENTIISITLIIDLFITQTTKATVAAYTILSNLDRLYDYAAYYETTNSGISYARVINKAGTAASATSYNITLTNTGSVWAFTGSELTINVGTSLGAGSTITGALFTSGLVTLLNAITDTTITANVLQTTPTNLTNVTITGNLTYNIGTSPTVTFTNSTVTGTLSNSGLGTVTITKVNATIGAVGTNIIAQQFASILAPNLLSGSRVRLYNITDLVEIYNGVLTSTGLNQSFLYTGDKTIKLTATYQNGTTAKLAVEANGAFTAGGLQFLNFQDDDLIYNSYAIDGSTISEFEADYVNDQIDLKIATNFLAAELYAWWVYNLTTINGIRDFVGGITAEDESNLRINANIISIKLDNTTTTNLIQIDNIRIYRSDSAYPVASPETSGGGGIQINWTNKVYTSTIDSNAIATINRNTKLIPALL